MMATARASTAETTTRTLAELLGRNGLYKGVKIAGLTADSRQVEPGWLFAALPGSCVDGRTFIPEAIERDAAAILTTIENDIDCGDVPVIREANPRRAFALAAARYYGRQPDCAVAVTGTNGKTSTVSFTRQIWRALGYKAASIGTLGVQCDDLTFPAGGLTTPDPVTLHDMLAKLADAGVGHLAFEASSHGLDQFRLDGVAIRAAAFLNLTRDHLDYHQDGQEYLMAKLRLFGDLLPPSGTAVVNADSDYADRVEDVAWARGIRLLKVGSHVNADLRLLDRLPRPDGQHLIIGWGREPYSVNLGLAGDFQAANALMAAGLAIATGEDPEDVLPALECLTGVAGRLEKIGTTPSGGVVYVDYAHTPDGLRTVLSALRPHTEGRLLAVIGAGGDRDPGKRPLMGKIAARLADLVYVTDDNPRTESPAAIRAEIMPSCPGAHEIGDRSEAIRTAIAALEDGDVVVICGKGHEQGQVVGDRILPMSDPNTCAEAISELGGTLA